MSGEPALYTIGHSTRSTEEFLDLLEEHRIALLVDVRRYPVSRRHPQFGREALARALAERGIAYRHEEDLGGRREPSAPAPPGAPRGAEAEAFRGYEEHTETRAFREAAQRVLDDAQRRRTVVMCAEARPERCHRKLLAGYCVAQGRRVVHILARGESADHAALFARRGREPDLFGSE